VGRDGNTHVRVVSVRQAAGKRLHRPVPGLVESPLDEEDPRTAFTFDVVVRWRMA